MTKILRLLLIMALLPLGIAATATPARAEGVTRLRIGVVEDGIYRLRPADLADAGIDPATVDPTTFAMSSLGQTIAIRVTGEADGRFDGDDFIEFFGEKFRGTEMEEKYTDERVYWLDIGGAGGPRLPAIDASPDGSLTPPTDFATTLHAEEDLYWFALHTNVPESKDTWFWDDVTIGKNSQKQTTLSAVAPYPTDDSEMAFRIVLNGRAWITRQATVSVNDDPTIYADGEWFGKFRKELTGTLPAGLIQHGNNDVHVTFINDTTKTDRVYVNYWEVDYRRLFRAWEGRIDFRVEGDGPHEYQIDGWTSSEIAIWDVSDPASSRRLTGASAVPGDVGKAVRFRANDREGDRYWLQAVASIAAPASVQVRPPTGLRSPERGADAVIVTSEELRPAAEELAVWHESRGRRALVAVFDDVVDEFNDGIYNPRAVPAMLAWAQDNWPGAAPQYLTLVGDGHWNFKGFNPDLYPPQPNHIPPFLAFSDPWQGEVPVEAYYADIDGDGVQDIAVGRLAVNTLEEAQAVVHKITSYDETFATQDWQRRAIFVADNKDSAVNDFPGQSDAIIAEHLPDVFTPERIYLEETVPDAEAGRAAITDAINDGALLLQYAGHGAPYRWTHELMWTNDYVPDLTNVDRLPVVMTFNCLDGYFVHPSPSLFGIAEVMQRYENGGSVAAISPTGLGLTSDQHRFRSLLLDIIFKDDVRDLGRALLLTKLQFEDEFGYEPTYLLDTMTLFGDPAMRIPQTAEREFMYLPTVGW